MHLRRRTRLSFVTLVFCLMLAAISQAAYAADKNFDKNEFAARRARLLEQMPDGIAIIPAGDAHIHAVKFRQSPDFFYLTGIEEPGAVLVLLGSRKMSVVFAHKRPSWKINVEGPGILDMEKPADAYALTQVQNIQSLIPFFNVMSKEAKRLYVPLTAPDSLQMARNEMQQHETERTTHPLYRYTPPLKQAIARLHELQPHLTLTDINPLLDVLRWVKSPYEIQRMRESGRIGAEGVKVAMRGTKPGMFEYELEAAARFVYTKLGARGDAFMPIVASGPNTVTWHYSENSRRMEAGDVVLMDYGTDYDYYTSDITRTWPVSGTFTPEQEKMYRCILEARNAIIAAMKPGVTVANLQDAAEVVYKKHGFHQQFLQLGRYVGHHVGLSVHDVDPPDDAQVFKPGVVFNVEPLLEFRDKKIHMRLEDTVLITENGAENLTAGVPAELDAVYALIKEKGLSIN